MSRFEEVVNEAIGEVVLGESTFSAETLAEHIAAARARAPGRPARRGQRRGALPGAQARAGLGHPDPGALHAARVAVCHRARHPPADRRHRPGHDRVPVRAGAGRRRARASAWRPTASAPRRSSGSSTRSRSPPTTSAGWARCTSAAPSCATTRSTPATLLEIVEQLDVLGDLRADEALRRGARRREGAPPAALRRGLRARDGAAASSTRFPDLDDRAFVSARQVNLETIHQHNVVAERFGTARRDPARACDRRAPRRVHTTMRAWLDALPRPAVSARGAATAGAADAPAWLRAARCAEARRSSRRPTETVTATVT